MRVIAPHVDVDSRGARGRPERAVGNGHLAGQDADALGAGVDQRILDDRVTEHLDRVLQAVEQFSDRGDIGRVDVPAHTARLHHAVVVAVAGDQLEDVQHVFAESPGPHPDRVEAEEMPGQTQPQQVRMNALQFADRAADKQRPLGNLDIAGILDGLHAGHWMRGGADTADAFDQKDRLLEVFASESFSIPRWL